MMNRVRAFVGRTDVKWPLVVLVGGLWVLGLLDQLESTDMTLKYLGLSAALGTLFFIA